MSVPARATPSDWDGTRDRIVELKCQGKGVSFISLVVGLPKHTVERLLKQEFDTRLGGRQELIQNTALELQWVKGDLVSKYMATGDRRDAELALKYQERLCKLFGLDAPVKVDVKYEELSDADLQRELVRNSISTTLLPVADADPDLPMLELGVEAERTVDNPSSPTSSASAEHP